MSDLTHPKANIQRKKMLQNKLVFIITKKMFLNEDSSDKPRISNEQSWD